MKNSLAIAYAMKKKAQKMAEGGEVDKDEVLDKEMEDAEIPEDSGPDKDLDKDIKDNDNIVDRIMAKKYSEGGMVSNKDGPIADSTPNEFDDLVLRDDLDFSYDGANSGDHLGNEQLEDDERDVVKRAYRSWAKKDKLPRPL